jgi:hypothetical protein
LHSSVKNLFPFAPTSVDLVPLISRSRHAPIESAPHEDRCGGPGHLAVLVRRPVHDLELPAKRALQFRGAVPGLLEKVLAALEAIGALGHRLRRFAEVFVLGVRIPVAEQENKFPTEALLQRSFGGRRTAASGLSPPGK